MTAQQALLGQPTVTRPGGIALAILAGIAALITSVMASAGGTDELVLLVPVAFGFLVYFLPAIIAVVRCHHQGFAIVMLNWLTGWTVVGWVAALVWSSTAERNWVS